MYYVMINKNCRIEWRVAAPGIFSWVSYNPDTLRARRSRDWSGDRAPVGSRGRAPGAEPLMGSLKAFSLVDGQRIKQICCLIVGVLQSWKTTDIY